MPYSRSPVGAAALLSDGTWVAGARVENASFPLTIPAATAAMAIARVAGRAGDVRAVAVSTPFEAGEAEALAAGIADALAPQGLALAPAGLDALVTGGALPYPTTALSTVLELPAPADDAAGAAIALRAAESAHVPASGFRVGCVIFAADGRLYTGANVEQADWTRGLCAERVALATVVAAGAGPPRRIWVACAAAGVCSPCGACRQVLAEIAPMASIVLSRGGEPDITSVGELLPGAFDGAQLRSEDQNP